ncbi:hypothetical protein JM84_0548 [Dokdonia sp. Hel_I_63]|jgi:hypothetical protein|uniref:DUF6730 family protein n=1 Tax=unclassified Dokdonia TaxID=2615033 RepID=UPI00020A6F49|nr:MULTISPECIES: DUF6730 family protein [unclassified Dokdonia]AEE19098.1 hypothetical protein Krodi_1114 [Dokdonia sp. 4H-3-7-5]AWH73798.1 hypothetical protein DCS32_06410 [Dokdonia sp. Dokd-P16]TVZ21670.1 hypothetical protein JM84_0548 [Dokdonia sp. Hel_I_63]|tara:strand:+ start:61217 stop:61534 length:318 start_codon:yes stop_codon:yes gene_type:complete
MTRLETISQLLVEELETFKEQIDRLEKVSENLKDVRVKADSSAIEKLLSEHLKIVIERSNEQQTQLENMHNRIKSAKLYPNWLIVLTLLLFLSMAFLIGYLLLFH